MDRFYKLFWLEGRIARRVYLPLIFIINILTKGLLSIQGTLLPIAIAVVLILTWISFTASVKRAHDIDRSGWWPFISSILVSIGFLVFLPHFIQNGWNFTTVFSGFLGMIGILIGAYISFAPGDKGDNRFGEDPRSR